MKPRIMTFWQSVAAVVAAAVLLGCESKAGKANQAKTADPSVSNPPPSALTQTNLPADKEPLKKIAPAPFNTSPGVEEVIKLAESGVEEAVILAFIESSPSMYNLSVDEI